MKMQVLKNLSRLSLAVTLAVAAVYANPAGPLKADVPFDFSVGGETLPAGVYTVMPMTTQNVLRIRREDGRAAALVITNDAPARRGQDQTRLGFHRYGDRYFLAQVWTAGDSNGRELGQSRAERELIKSRSKNLAQKAVEPEVIYIAAQ